MVSLVEPELAATGCTSNLARSSPGGFWRVASTLCSFPAVIAGCLAALVFAVCKYQVDDPDIWWHLRNARYLAEHLRLPNLDTYSFTVAGSAWINHEWLSELFYYLSFTLGGWHGVYIAFSSLLALIFIVVFCLCRLENADPLAAGIASIAGAILAIVGFGPRTQHLGWLCFVAIYAILLSFRSARKAPLWAIPPLFALWINCHGGWSVGLTVYAIFFCCGLIPRNIGPFQAAPWSKADLKKLAITGAASIAALFVNPYGYQLVIYPYEYASRLPLNIAVTDEWQPLSFGDHRGQLVAVILAGLFGLALLRRKRWRMDDAVLTAFVLYCGLSHVRFLLIAGIVLPPILAPKLPELSSYDPRKQHRFLNSLLLAGLAAICIHRLATPAAQGKELAPSFPSRAITFLRDHPQPGRMFNHYSWGGYVEWNLPEVPVFIDSRVDIFEFRGVLKEYLQIATLNRPQELLDRYGVGYVLYDANSRLTHFLSSSPHWQCVYRDDQAVIFRRTANNSRS